MGNYLSIMGQSLEHNRIKTRELGNSIIGKNWSIMWQGLVTVLLEKIMIEAAAVFRALQRVLVELTPRD